MNRQFVEEFLAADVPYCAMGMIEEGKDPELQLSSLKG